MAINLNNLSVEILLQIFKHCNIKDLCKLKEVCKRFHIIINTYKIITQEQHTLVTNQIKLSMINRSLTLLNPFDKWRISHNWKIGRCKFIKLLKQKTKFMPWLFLDKQYLWLSLGKNLNVYERTNTNVLHQSPTFTINNDLNEDIVRFRIKNKLVISGLRGGAIWIWSLDQRKCILNQHRLHTDDVTDVDITRDIFISSSSDRSYSVWPLELENYEVPIPTPLQTNFLDDKIWCIGLSSDNKNLAVGSAGFNNVPPFHVFDVERNLPILNLQSQSYPYGAGILDIHWENDNTILTCGYETILKKWDLRSGHLVQKWEDPHNDTNYCLASDDMYTVLTGTSTYGRVVLWDQRIQHRYIQMYFTSNSSSLYRSSPVYSMQFDSCQLFSALDQNVSCLDFSNSVGKVRNYAINYKSVIYVN